MSGKTSNGEDGVCIACREVQKVRRNAWTGGMLGFVLGAAVGASCHYLALRRLPALRLNRSTRLATTVGVATMAAYIGSLESSTGAAHKAYQTYTDGKVLLLKFQTV